MSLRLIAALSGNLEEFLKGERTALAQKITDAINRQAVWLRDQLRGQVRAAHLGAGLEKAWRSEVYPRGRRASLRAVGLVYSKSPVLHAAFAEGATVAPGGAKVLVIPSAEAITMGFGATTEGRTPRGIPGGARRKYGLLGKAIERLGAENLAFIPIGGGRRVVIYRPPQARRNARGGRRVGGFQLLRGTGSVLLFTLIPDSVTLRKRLDIDGPAEQALTNLFAEIARD